MTIFKGEDGLPLEPDLSRSRQSFMSRASCNSVPRKPATVGGVASKTPGM